MSKFFMYGSELQETEQLMMLVPNFLPRRSGVVYVNLKVPQNIIEISPRGNLKYPYDKS
ncbi:hypothetical protein [Acetoanaerobium noterae]|uniref:hypothetical protein n=1 Tax=Acetoanaerobium noterae TaxID=745369 RepID=UPI0028AB6653|nr:hypothetical protein [Acetoanaerobium noterae]